MKNKPKAFKLVEVAPGESTSKFMDEQAIELNEKTVSISRFENILFLIFIPFICESFLLRTLESSILHTTFHYFIGKKFELHFSK